VAAAACVGVRRQVVHVDDVPPGQVVQFAKAGHGDAALALEGAHDPVPLGPLHLVHAAHERGLVAVVGAQRAHGLEGQRGLARVDLAELGRGSVRTRPSHVLAA
jgi:alpha-beta hydrolase superfamily lysophospholipase